MGIGFYCRKTIQSHNSICTVLHERAIPGNEADTVQNNKQHHGKVLLRCFDLNGYKILSAVSNIGTTLYSTINSTTGKYCSLIFSFQLKEMITIPIFIEDSKARNCIYRT